MVSHGENVGTGVNISALRNGILPGSCLVVIATVEDAAAITSISDGAGITRTVADVAVDWTAGTQRAAAYVIPNHPGGNRTFVANFTPTQTFRGIRVIEFVGAHLVSPFTGSSTGQGSSAAPSAGAVAAPFDGSYIVGYALGATALTKGATFNDLLNEPTITDDIEGCTQKFAGLVTPVWTMTSGIWAALGLSLRPAEVATGLIAPQSRRG